MCRMKGAPTLLESRAAKVKMKKIRKLKSMHSEAKIVRVD